MNLWNFHQRVFPKFDIHQILLLSFSNFPIHKHRSLLWITHYPDVIFPKNLSFLVTLSEPHEKKINVRISLAQDFALRSKIRILYLIPNNLFAVIGDRWSIWTFLSLSFSLFPSTGRLNYVSRVTVRENSAQVRYRSAILRVRDIDMPVNDG